VAVDGHISDLSPVISGVPQGSVLGPILFLLHIADIARDVSPGTMTSSYVDDTRANRCITNPDTDCQILQDDLEGIYHWAEDVNMVFNSDKFECLRFWPGKSSKPDNQYLSPDNTPIEEKLHLRDLGVEISSDLSFSMHIENTISASTRLVGWVLRTFRRRSKHVMMTIWKSLIQSKLDYCSQLWCPTDQSSIGRIESVARHFTSQISGLSELGYWERLQVLRLYSQERRRERYRIIFIWKVLQGLVLGYPITSHQNPRRGRL
jgi:ribonuclease P/MRP protein subunit RPP40